MAVTILAVVMPSSVVNSIRQALNGDASVWLRAADSAASAQRADEARQWLQRVASSGAPQAGQAQARLKAL